MVEKQVYQIKVQGILVVVSKDVYLTYYRMERQERTLKEKDSRNGKDLYNAWDTDTILGQDMIPDTNTNVEETALSNLLYKQLHQCMDMLPASERDLLHAIYFDGLSERQLSKKTGIPQRTINDRKKKALSKLKKMLNI